jgi:nucleotidyltransferase substrate binding protein (TIGR01987 family)
MQKDIRWKQRFENYQNAFFQLQNAIQKYKKEGLNELEKQGLIQTFEHTYELSWNLLRDYLIYQGITDIKGARDAIQLAYKYNLIEDGESWIQILTSRNLSSHTYNEKIIEKLLKEITEKYFQNFKDLEEKFKKIKNESI